MFGVLLESLLTLRNTRSSILPLLIFSAISLAAFIPGRNEHEYHFYNHIILYAVLFSITVAYAFKDDLLPCLNEMILLSYAITFWAVVYPHFSGGGAFSHILFWLLLVPSAATLYSAFVELRTDFFSKLFFYAWFLVMLVAIAGFAFPSGYIAMFVESQPLPKLDLLGTLFSGMAFFYLMINALYIFLLIPIPGKNQSMASRMIEWHELTDLMTSRCDFCPLPLWQTALLFALQILFIVINTARHVMPDAFAISILLLVAPLFHGSGTVKKALAGKRNRHAPSR